MVMAVARSARAPAARCASAAPAVPPVMPSPAIVDRDRALPVPSTPAPALVARGFTTCTLGVGPRTEAPPAIPIAATLVPVPPPLPLPPPPPPPASLSLSGPTMPPTPPCAPPVSTSTVSTTAPGPVAAALCLPWALPTLLARLRGTAGGLCEGGGPPDATSAAQSLFTSQGGRAWVQVVPRAPPPSPRCVPLP